MSPNLLLSQDIFLFCPARCALSIHKHASLCVRRGLMQSHISRFPGYGIFTTIADISAKFCRNYLMERFEVHNGLGRRFDLCHKKSASGDEMAGYA
ncbi:hypothetical protein [Aquicoccus porphyridii]|uniref:hypothetical protein n=1 Tax=Aquicoccus porphyridii TaxID=1852029 RepID=UPI00273E4DB0|nr:hypothetical protein [Aquicoccus porphyridii]